MAETHRTSLAPERPARRKDPGEELEVSERERMRSLLAAIEPDRTLDDWGRSERVERIFDATLVEFFYRYWFRCEVEGDRERAGERWRAARLQSLRRPASRCGDDRQGRSATSTPTPGRST